MSLRRSLALLALLLPSTAAAQADAWFSHVSRLAADSMRGRETGSAEHRKAAEYIAAGFARAGLRPAGTEGFFQPVRFTVRRIDESQSRLALVQRGVAAPITLGTEATIGLRGSSAGRVRAPLVFAGYGVLLPDQGLDPLNGLDLRGAVLVTVQGGVPKGVPGPVIASGRARFAAAARAAGALGTIGVASPRADVPWARASLARLSPQMQLGDTPDGSAGIAITWNPAHAALLFADAERSYADLQALADAGAALPSFALAAQLDATVNVAETTVMSDNVIGLLPGTDPALKQEYLVLTAHLDHVGVGQPIEGDSIYNGAMDNASGIATLLETAATLAARAEPLKRSVLFVAVTAEEKGLLGSRWFAEQPTVPSSAIVANLNTDMFLPINPLKHLLVNGLEESDLADDVRRAGARVGVTVVTDPEPERNAFVRSDQFSFIRLGMPALSLKVGFLKDSPEHQRVLRWRQERYHGPKDDLTQPIDRQAAADFNGLYAVIIEEVANRSSRPAWFSTSVYKPRVATP